MASGDNQEERKNFGGFGLFLVAALLGVMWLQSFFEANMAKVAFSYQVEHLVNLALIQPEKSQKTATAGSLVNVSGRFVDQLSDQSRQRFHYIELVQELHELQAVRAQSINQWKALRLQALGAIDLYAHLRGLQLPSEGIILSLATDFGDGNEPVVLEHLSHIPGPSLAELMAQYALVRSHMDQLPIFTSQLTDWVGALASPKLGIANDAMKQQIRGMITSLEQVSHGADPAKNIATIDSTLGISKHILEQLDDTQGDNQGDWRFTQLRSVRDLKETGLRLTLNNEQIAQVQAQLDKQRTFVKGVIWFYNNHELSSVSLEKQDSEEYSHWFERAKSEWDRFELNKGLPFQASDQPSYLVLERTFHSQEAPPNYLGLFFTMMPVFLVALLIYFMFSKQAKGMGGAGGALTFGKSPAKLLQKGTHKITFKDVAGIEEAKEELQEIVDFLKDPGKFTSLGAEIPKGVLCVGPPGTGKTLIAKAVAGEADRPFFSISGSDFVEMFVGVGASRIRDMFKEAKKQAPCIIFMDEIDAVGRHRGVGMGGGHDEREQTLNQLLVEMDGFDSNEGIILMAATNRPDVLDKALLRPGRFDRRVTIDLPDIKGRYEILKLHARKIKMSDGVDLMRVARGTPGGSGADLKNILNEAALRAVHQGHDSVKDDDVDYATDKVRFGKERRSFEMTKEEIRRTAYHEAGHAIVGIVCKRCDPVEKVTVIPRGMSLGATYTLPKGNRVGYWKEELADILAMIMGGRAAEEIFIQDISSGAQSDIQRVTQLARSMVCEWGMSDKVGQIAYDERSESGVYLSGAQANAKPYSEQTALTIDGEVRLLIQQAHSRARTVIEAHRAQLDLMAQMLIEFETLDAQDVQEIMALTFDKVAKEKRVRGDSVAAKTEESTAVTALANEATVSESIATQALPKDESSSDSHKDES